MFRHWFRHWLRQCTALAAYSLLLGLTGCLFGSGSSSFSYVHVTSLERPDHPDDGYSDVYACVGERVQLEYRAEGAATLSANPADAFDPALSATQVSGEGTLDVEVRKAATLMLDTLEDNYEVSLELIPEDICTGFPTDLLSRFSGTLIQETPTPQTLPRQLTFYWQDSGIGAVLAETNEESFYGLPLACNADSAADTVRCSGTDADFTLDISVSTDGLTGSYEGSVQDSIVESAFAGTLDFTVAR